MIFKTGLIVLNPRIVPKFEESLKHLKSLDVPIVRIHGYTETEIAAQDGAIFSEALDHLRTRHSCTHAATTSDDCIIPPDSFRAITQHSYHERDAEFEFFTSGWANMDETSDLAGLSDSPLPHERPLGPESYDFPTWRDVLAGPAVRKTYFTGFVGTCAPIQLWHRYPFRCFSDHPQDPGYASDYHLSRRLQADNLPIDALRAAFCLHLKTATGTLDPYPLVTGRGIFE